MAGELEKARQGSQKAEKQTQPEEGQGSLVSGDLGKVGQGSQKVGRVQLGEGQEFPVAGGLEGARAGVSEGEAASPAREGAGDARGWRAREGGAVVPEGRENV